MYVWQSKGTGSRYAIYARCCKRSVVCDSSALHERTVCLKSLLTFQQTANNAAIAKCHSAKHSQLN